MSKSWWTQGTSVSAAETATGADASSLAAAPAPTSQTGSGVDASVLLPAASAETGSGVDASSVANVPPSSSETGSGADASSLAAAPPATGQTGTGVDTASTPAIGSSGSDSGSGTDSAAVSRSVAGTAETASGADASVVSPAPVASTTFAQAIASWPGLIALYPLGEPSGTTMTDLSPNANHGTYSGSPALATAGLLAGDAATCIDFDGVDDVGLAAHIAAYDVGTADYWYAFAVDIVSNVTGFVLNTEFGDHEAYFDGDSFHHRMAGSGALDVVSGTGIRNTGRHLIYLLVKRSGGVAQWYVDNVASGAGVDVSAQSATSLASAVGLRIGRRDPADGTAFFPDKLQFVAMGKSGLPTAQQRSDLYAIFLSGPAGSAAGLAETGSAVETAVVTAAAGITGSETGTFTETSSQTMTLGPDESVATVDTASLAVAHVRAESAVGTDVASPIGIGTTPESGAGVDAATVAPAPTAETAAATDTAALTVIPVPTSEAGTAVDVASLAAAIVGSETGGAVEQAVLSTDNAKAASDTGHGDDVAALAAAPAASAESGSGDDTGATIGIATSEAATAIEQASIVVLIGASDVAAMADLAVLTATVTAYDSAITADALAAVDRTSDPAATVSPHPRARARSLAPRAVAREAS